MRWLILVVVILFAGCTTIEELIVKERYNEAAAGIAALPEAQRKDGYSKLAAAYHAKGDLDRAFEYYAAAEDRPGLEKLAAELLKRKEYDKYVDCWQEARRQRLFHEEFRDNSRGWNLRKDAFIDASIAADRLSLKKLVTERTSYVWTAAGLKPEQDFLIETRFTKLSGADNNAIALAWGMQNADENHQFGVSGDGHYYLGKYVDGKFTRRLAWTSHPAVRQGNAENSLAVRRTGPALRFYVNGVQVAESLHEKPRGERVGFLLSPKAEVDFHYLAVSTFPPPGEVFSEIGDGCFYNSDFESAVKYFGKAGNAAKLNAVARQCADLGRPETALKAFAAAGYSERTARLKLAAVCAGLGRTDEAGAWLDKAGRDPRQKYSFDLAEEKFADNGRKWAERRDKEAVLEVKNGVYHIESVSDAGRLAWIDFDLSPAMDFKIEAKLRKLSGAEDKAYSLVWGFSGSGEYQELGVTAKGSFEHGCYENGRWKQLVGHTRAAPVRPGKAANALAIIRAGEELRFFVNGAPVGKAPFREFKGGGVGFAVDGRQAVEVDDLRIVEFAPAFARELAAASPAGGELAARRAALSAELGDWPDALEQYAALKDEKNLRLCRIKLAEQALAADDHERAMDWYRRAGQADQVRAVALAAADDRAKTGNWAEAAELYRAGGDAVEPLAGLAKALRALGREREADQALARAGDLDWRAGKKNEAAVRYRALQDPAAAGSAAEKLFSAGMLEDAAELFKTAGSEAGLRSARTALAERRFEQGDYGEALELFKLAGLAARAAECEKKLGEIAVVPGKWAGGGLEFTVGPDGSTIKDLRLTAALRDGRYSVMMTLNDIAVVKRRFECSLGYPAVKLAGNFTRRDLLKVLVNGTTEIHAAPVK